MTDGTFEFNANFRERSGSFPSPTHRIGLELHREPILTSCLLNLPSRRNKWCRYSCLKVTPAKDRLAASALPLHCTPCSCGSVCGSGCVGRRPGPVHQVGSGTERRRWRHGRRASHERATRARPPDRDRHAGASAGRVSRSTVQAACAATRTRQARTADWRFDSGHSRPLPASSRLRRPSAQPRPRQTADRGRVRKRLRLQPPLPTAKRLPNCRTVGQNWWPRLVGPVRRRAATCTSTAAAATSAASQWVLRCFVPGRVHPATAPGPRLRRDQPSEVQGSLGCAGSGSTQLRWRQRRGRLRVLGATRRHSPAVRPTLAVLVVDSVD